MTIKHEIIEITPERAQELLEHNTVNRPLKDAAVKRYAKDMKEGRWEINGEAIMVSEEGTLLNGQNRLHACVEAGVPFTSLFVSGLNGNSLDTIDVGVPRSLADQLHWRGVTHASEMAAACKWLYRYDTMVEKGFRQLGPNAAPPRHEWLDYFDTYEPHFTSAAGCILPNRRHLPGPRSVHMFVHVLMSRVRDFKTADTFWNEVAFGSESSAATLLKNWMLDRAGPYKRPPNTVQAAVEVKAARLWLKGIQPKTLLWKRTTSRSGEAFPRIDQDMDDDMITTS